MGGDHAGIERRQPPRRGGGCRHDGGRQPGREGARRRRRAAQGSRVWLDMDQKELDDAYDQAVYAPNSRAGRVAPHGQQRGGARPPRLQAGLAYGPTPVEMLDIYATKAPNAPVMVSFHGGAWRAGSAKDNAEAAELFVNAGAHYVVLDFANVMELGGSLFPMVEQVRRGVAWVYKMRRASAAIPTASTSRGARRGLRISAASC